VICDIHLIIRGIILMVMQVSTEIRTQLSLSSDLPVRLLAMRRQLIGSAGSLRRYVEVTLDVLQCGEVKF
jgi:hypothetical protein